MTIQKTITINTVKVLVLSKDEAGKYRQVHGIVEFIGRFSARKLKKAIAVKYQAKQYIVEAISTKQCVYVMDEVKFMTNATLIKTIEE